MEALSVGTAFPYTTSEAQYDAYTSYTDDDDDETTPPPPL